jgi:hypothetical protein
MLTFEKKGMVEDDYPKFLKKNDSHCLRVIEFKKLISDCDSRKINATEFKKKDKELDSCCLRCSKSEECSVPVIPSFSGENSIRWRGYVII